MLTPLLSLSLSALKHCQTLNVYDITDIHPIMFFTWEQGKDVCSSLSCPATDAALSVLPDGMSSNPKADFYIDWATTHNSAAYHSPMHVSWFAVALYKCVSHVVFMHCRKKLLNLLLEVNYWAVELKHWSERSDKYNDQKMCFQYTPLHVVCSSGDSRDNWFDRQTSSKFAINN